jgi:hypothetical protein
VPDPRARTRARYGEPDVVFGTASRRPGGPPADVARGGGTRTRVWGAQTRSPCKAAIRPRQNHSRAGRMNPNHSESHRQMALPRLPVAVPARRDAPQKPCADPGTAGRSAHARPAKANWRLGQIKPVAWSANRPPAEPVTPSARIAAGAGRETQGPSHPFDLGCHRSDRRRRGRIARWGGDQGDLATVRTLFKQSVEGRLRFRRGAWDLLCPRSAYRSRSPVEDGSLRESRRLRGRVWVHEQER